MTQKSQIKLGRIGTIGGIVVIAGLLYYIITRRDAIVDRAFGALDRSVGGSGAAPAPEEEIRTTFADGTETITRPQGSSSAPRQPTGALYRVINYYQKQTARQTETQRRQETVRSFQNAFPDLAARYSSQGNRLIVTDRNNRQYATSATPNARENFYNSIRNQRPTGTFGGAVQRAAAPANARRALERASPGALANFRNALTASRGYQSRQRFN